MPKFLLTKRQGCIKLKIPPGGGGEFKGKLGGNKNQREREEKGKGKRRKRGEKRGKEREKQARSDNAASEVDIFIHFRTFWDIMGQFEDFTTTLEQLDHFPSHFDHFLP